MSPDLKPKERASQHLGRLKMLLMIDEAKVLVSKKFFNAFRWIIDQVIEPSWISGNRKRARRPLPFMVFFLGTNSKVADFLPPGKDSSARYFTNFMKVPPPFTALDWDIAIPKDSILHYSTLKYESLAEMTWLCRFGRAYWQAQWGTTVSASYDKVKDACCLVTAAEIKLHQSESRDSFRQLFVSPRKIEERKETEGEEFILTCSAILAVLAVINLDFTSPKHAENLVASRLRWAIGCDSKRNYLLTTYPSEPLLAEAAFRLLFATTDDKHCPGLILRTILEVVAEQVERGDDDVGGDGELVARVMCKRLPKTLLNYQIGLLALRQSLQVRYPDVDIDMMELSSRGDPLLYSQRLTPVTTFLNCLFKDTWVTAMRRTCPDVCQTLDNGYINFSHFTEELAHKDTYDSLTAHGLFALFLRGCAIQCKQGQPGIDIVIPMAVLPHPLNIHSSVSILHISAIILQVKNRRKDPRLFDEQFSAKKFDLRHIQGVSETNNLPYVGIWMSLGVDDVEVCIEGCSDPFLSDCKRRAKDCHLQTRGIFISTRFGTPISAKIVGIPWREASGTPNIADR